MDRSRSSWLIVLAIAATALAGTTYSAFSSVTFNASNRVTAAPDFRAPQASASAGAKVTPYLAGRIRQNATYYVYANASDTGNPASGIATVRADVSAITTGQTAAALSAGSFTAQGTSYNYRSAALTANAVLTEGAKSYSLTLNDNASNSRVQTGYSVTVDNTAPSATDIQAANGGATVGRAEAGDTLVYTFSEAMDPDTIASGWTASGAQNVVLRLVDGGLGNDTVQIWNAANTAQLPLGSVDLGRIDYILTGTATFGASGTASAMTMSGSAVTITLGTAGGSGTNTAAGNGTMTWTPSATPTDGAGNPMSVTPRTETGAADREF